MIEECKWKTIRTRVRPRAQWATQCTKRKGKGNVQEAAAAVAARLEPRKQRSSNSRKPVIQPGNLAHPMMPSWTQVRAANRLCFLRRHRRLSTTSCRSRWVPWTVGSRERRPHNQCSLPQLTSCLRSSPRRGQSHCQVDSKMDNLLALDPRYRPSESRGLRNTLDLSVISLFFALSPVVRSIMHRVNPFIYESAPPDCP